MSILALAKALGRANHPAPRVISTDKHAGYPPAIVQLKAERRFGGKCFGWEGCSARVVV